ncbi:MAG: effector binding domain-containing protein [Butyrivibrio sp.]|nr:effector binding domain-containing protein [Butyrivibrio sp.]
MMRRDIITKIRSILSYIEQHLFDTTLMEDLDRKFETRDLEPEFQVISGLSIKKYIFGRRMSEAAKEIVSGENVDQRFSERYGYTGEKSFYKAFSSYHGASVNQIKNHKVPYRQFNPISFDLVVSGREEPQFKIIDIDGYTKELNVDVVVLDIDTKTLNDRRREYISTHGNGTSELYSMVCKVADDRKTILYYQESFGGEEKTKFRRTIPPMTCIVFTFTGPLLETIDRNIEYLKKKWLEDHQYQIVDNCHFEIYKGGEIDDSMYQYDVMFILKINSLLDIFK